MPTAAAPCTIPEAVQATATTAAVVVFEAVLVLGLRIMAEVVAVLQSLMNGTQNPRTRTRMRVGSEAAAAAATVSFTITAAAAAAAAHH